MRGLEILALLLLPIFLLGFSFAQAEEKSTEMNGYHLNDFSGFEKKWPLVTVRYRKDTGEMRFTYANPKAYKALLAGKNEYPDGAVFAKIGVSTSSDPAFESSAVPSGAKRYQLMVRDQKKNAATGGWGYAIFDAAGKVFPEDPKIATQACFACHQIVPQRGQVFSQPLHFSPGASALAPPSASTSGLLNLQFNKLSWEKVPKELQKNSPWKFTEMLSLDGNLRKYLFQGTLDEIRPLLVQKALETHLPAGLISDDGLRFSVIFPKKEKAECEESGKKGTSLQSVMTLGTKDDHGNSPVVKIDFCQTR